MTLKAANEISVGWYTGICGEKYKDAGFLKQLEGISNLLEAGNAEVITSGRNRNIKTTLSCHDKPLELVVKVFGRQSAMKDRIDEKRGSKARRTWEAASCLAGKGVGTPPPVGFLECWQDRQLVESYYLAEYQHGLSSFKDELIHLFVHDPECEKFMSLLQCVANAVKAMHDAGFIHNDLGNQNILLRRKDDVSWGDVQFVDLNRGRTNKQLSLREKARDISRIYLPSDLLRVFKEMYFAPTVPPSEFQEWEKWYRRLYSVHSGTRWIRHPIRTRRIKKKERGRTDYPSEKDMWIWDERSGQPISIMRPADRSRYYGLERPLQVVKTTIPGLFPVWMQYTALLRDCYQKPISLKDRIGMAINPRPDTADRELALLKELGTIPVLMRFCSHESEKEWGFLAHIVKTLHGEGHSVSVALVQDRNAVTNPRVWALFVAYVLERISGHVDSVEIGHAINRVKWGVWDFEEHRRLVDAVAAITDRYPDVKFMGPSVIDFEYPFLMAALDNVPEKLHLSALSHHLYVDRRGAPENRQGPFSALEKFALVKAIARCSSKCDDNVVVSEVNWPLKGTGVYSPVGSPYESPGLRFNDPSITEDEYADYMLRYLVMAICSGMIDRVFWWRLVARGYGLIDDTDARDWKKRPAYLMLKYFLLMFGESEFFGKLTAGKGGIHLFMFTLRDGRKVCFAYSSVGEMSFELPFGYSDVVSATGEKLANSSGNVLLSSRPVYVFLK